MSLFYKNTVTRGDMKQGLRIPLKYFCQKKKRGGGDRGNKYDKISKIVITR